MPRPISCLNIYRYILQNRYIAQPYSDWASENCPIFTSHVHMWKINLFLLWQNEGSSSWVVAGFQACQYALWLRGWTVCPPDAVLALFRSDNSRPFHQELRFTGSSWRWPLWTQINIKSQMTLLDSGVLCRTVQNPVSSPPFKTLLMHGFGEMRVFSSL